MQHTRRWHSANFRGLDSLPAKIADGDPVDLMKSLRLFSRELNVPDFRFFFYCKSCSSYTSLVAGVTSSLMVNVAAEAADGMMKMQELLLCACACVLFRAPLARSN